MPLACVFAVPAIVGATNVFKGLAAFTAVLVPGLFLLRDQPTGAVLGFVLVGVANLGALLYCVSAAASRLAEARRGLQTVRARSLGVTKALDKADVPVVVLGHNQVWLSANSAAWRATGVQASVYQKIKAPFELDCDAVIALMHSASAHEMRRVMEALGSELSQVGDGKELTPRIVTLRDEEAREQTYSLVFHRGRGQEVVMVAVPFAVS